MHDHRFSARRQFLRGAGGLTLGLPFLPSLLPRGANAQARRLPRFLLLSTGHGGVRGANMVPADAALTRQMDMFPGHTIRHGDLVRNIQGQNAVLSPVLTAPAALLSTRLVSKLNVLRGFDTHFYIAHHAGGHLGNFAATTGGTDVTQHRITIDQVMAYSNAFYPNQSGIRQRVLQAGEAGGYSWGYSNPSNKSGAVQRNDPSYQIDIIGNVFRAAIGDIDTNGGPANTPPPPTRASIADRVLENYRRLRNGSRRISNTDRQRLDDHIGRLSELEQKIKDNTIPPLVAASCRDVEKHRSTSDIYPRQTQDDATRYYQTLGDIIVAAFMCGTTRIGLLNVANPMIGYTGSWHQDIAHNHTGTEPQRQLVISNQRIFEKVFVHIASQLDSAQEDTDSTFLDNTYMQWSQESGTFTHDLQHATVVSAGSASGFFKTGQFVDYRNRIASKMMVRSDNTALASEDRIEYPGLSWRQYLGGVLQGMGIPRGEYERTGEPGGYGDPHAVSAWMNKISPEVMTRAGEIPMLLKA